MWLFWRLDAALRVLLIAVRIDYDRYTISAQSIIAANGLYVFLWKNLHRTVAEFDRLSGRNSDDVLGGF